MNEHSAADSESTRDDEAQGADAPPPLWASRYRDSAERALCAALAARGIDVTEEGTILQGDYDAPDDEELIELLMNWQRAVSMTKIQLGLAFMEPPRFPVSRAEREARQRRDYVEVERLAREGEALYDEWRKDKRERIRTVLPLPDDDR